MKALLFRLALLFVSAFSLVAAPTQIDYSHIETYIPPFYNSSGTIINVGPYSEGLASDDPKEFVATIKKMKQSWEQLSFMELYVAAIRLYDLGYRKESIYWFYTANYRSRLFAALVDQKKMGKIGDPGFELFHAAGAFHQLVSPYINAYAFSDFDSLTKIITKVQTEQRQNTPDLKAIYKKITFKPKTEWDKENKNIADKMDELLASIKTQEDEIRQKRKESGISEKISNLTNKELPE